MFLVLPLAQATYDVAGAAVILLLQFCFYYSCVRTLTFVRGSYMAEMMCRIHIYLLCVWA